MNVKLLLVAVGAYLVLSPKKPTTSGTPSGGQTPNQNNTGQIVNTIDDFINAAKSFFQSSGSGSGSSKAATDGSTGPNTNQANQTQISSV